MSCRVRVSLERYFSDERARAWVSLDARWSQVAALAAHVRELFRLSGDFCLLSAGHLLPAAEPLAPLLRDGDSLSVIPVDENWPHLAHHDERAVKGAFDEREKRDLVGDNYKCVINGYHDSRDLQAPTSPSPVSPKLTDRIGKKKKKRKQKTEPEDTLLAPVETSAPLVSPEPPAPLVSPEPPPPVVSPPTPASPVTAPLSRLSPCPPAAAPDQEALQSMKLRALALLSEVAGRASAARGGRITKRRRVRRRHARGPSPSPAPPPASCTRSPSPAVLRNVSPARAPRARTVRAQHDPQAPHEPHEPHDAD